MAVINGDIDLKIHISTKGANIWQRKQYDLLLTWHFYLLIVYRVLWARAKPQVSELLNESVWQVRVVGWSVGYQLNVDLNKLRFWFSGKHTFGSLFDKETCLENKLLIRTRIEHGWLAAVNMVWQVF